MLQDYNKATKKRKQVIYTKSNKCSEEIIREYLISQSTQKSIKVLDYGCGEMKFNLPGIEYYGFDIDLQNKKAHYHSLREIKGNFDIIILSHVIEHMYEPDLDKALAWCKKHSQQIIIAQPTSSILTIEDYFRDITHKKNYDCPDFIIGLEQKKFTILKNIHCSPKAKNPLKLLILITLAFALNTHFFKENLIIAKTN